MKYYNFLPLGALLLPLSLQAKEIERPNVLFILVDDYGWNDSGFMGSKYYETPNIDKLASEGMVFTNGYATCSVSSPSRASILTGKYTPRHGITDWIGERSGKEWRKMGRHSKLLPAAYKHHLSQSELTLPERLKEFGYKTFIAGKWHLGGDEADLPTHHGFDINKGGWGAGSPAGGYYTPYKNPQLEDGPKGENLTMRLSNETVKFIREHEQNNKKQPFFAYLSFYAVHGGIQCNKENWKHFRDKAIKMGLAKKGYKVDRTLPVRQVQDNPIYAGLIKQMDDAVGNVLCTLEELGIDKNTLIIFTGDNGGVTSGDCFSTSLKPLRGGKGRQWEGGTREPFIIKAPGYETGEKCDIPVIGTDFYPTILDYAHIPLVPEQHKDGVSLLPLLKGQNIADRCLYWHYPHYGNQGGEPCSYIRKGDWKLIYYYEDEHVELYNLATDISESEPLNIQHPEKVKELKTLLDVWLKDVGAVKPTADMEYDPIAEHKTKEHWQTSTMQNLEKERLKMLQSNYKPNKDWWGSYIPE